MSPHETLFRLEGTSELDIMTVDNNALAQFEIYDFPGSYMQSSPPERDASIFCNDSGQGVVIIFVLDAQDEPYDVVLTSLVQILRRGTRVNPSLKAHVFINKVDGELFLSEEAKYDCRRDVVSLVQEEMAEYDMEDVEVAYFLTSIYDHSVFEAFSKVTQKLVPTLPTISALCNVLVGRCNMEKVFLFDVVSKLYISTDSSPVDAVSYELCSDMIDVVMDEVSPMLALVCLTREEEFVKRGLLDWNLAVFKKGMEKLIGVINESKKAGV
ncbi:hypothetical protein TrRE_jg5492 [Triparma retinervis]|uniref:Uncharacterized protein n=1 Tax=Triparma retinervis TaxID=2557542 RepID=A0A9W6ZF50_9STRA|nr:hypothetical protein TrRE_jg5492 [Triparma retinervis]